MPVCMRGCWSRQRCLHNVNSLALCPAHDAGAQIADEVREARRDELVSLQQAVGEAWAKGLLGQELEVLVDGYTEDGEIYGRTQVGGPGCGVVL